MCRLFGMHAGESPAAATFWLILAPDSLQEQSHREPDGAGIGVFGPDAEPRVDKQPIAAWQDVEFAQDARRMRGTTFVAHVRYASTGAHTVPNTHPFVQDSRLFAHNGAFGDLDRLDARLAELGVADLVLGQTDSERMFALITGEIRERGEVPSGLIAALRWIAEQLPVFALNLVMSTATDLWAVRYPATHGLYVLERPAGQGEDLTVATPRVAARSAEADDRDTVVVASEPMDGESGWKPLAPGELLHVDADLRVTTRLAFPDQPRFPLQLADLSPTAAASQAPAAQTTS